jgi:hypothetical protein
MDVKFVDEESVIAYFQNLAKNHTELRHSIDKRKTFFFIVDKYDLSEFDQALRSELSHYPALLLDGIEGSLNDNGSANYTDEIIISFSILDKAKGKEAIRAARKKAKQIGMQFITRMRIDSNAGKFLVADSNVRFRIYNVNYEPIGRIDPDLYGYIFSFKIDCPFSFAPTNAIWGDL